MTYEMQSVENLQDELVRLELIKFIPYEVKEWAPAYLFKVMNWNNEPVGVCSLCAIINPTTINGGNIGYEIFPKYRNNGYATHAAKTLVKLAKRCGMPKIYVSCNSNESADVAKAIGCEFKETYYVPASLTEFFCGDRTRQVYYKTLSS